MSFVTSDHVYNFLKKLQKKGKEELKQSKAEDKRPTLAQFSQKAMQSLSKGGQELVEILESLLSLNPYFRMTASECLEKKVFDTCRNPYKEEVLQEMKKARLTSVTKNHIELEIDKLNSIDYTKQGKDKY